MNICIATYITDKVSATTELRVAEFTFKRDRYNVVFTFEIIFQLVDHFSIFHKRNSIKINLVVNPKLDVLPVFVCKKYTASKGC